MTEHLDGAARFTKYLLSFWFVYRLADSKEHVRDIMFAHLLGCTLLGVLCYLQGRTGDRLDGVGGPGMDDANTLGMYLATGVIVGLGLLITQRGWLRLAAFVGCAITLDGLVFTNTRGAFLALIGGWLAVAIFKARAHRRLFWALAAVGLIGLAVLVDEAFVERMWTIRDSTVDSEEADSSARSRIIVARAQWEMFLDYPMGSGHRGTAALSPRYLEDRWLTRSREGEQGARSSHNTFLTTLVEQGIPGAILFIWLALWTVLTLARFRLRDAFHRDAELTTLAATVGGVLAVVLVAGNTADFLMAEVQFWMFALFVTLLRPGDHGVRDSNSGVKLAAGPGLPTLSGGRG
jgi:O-antigen ligase